MVDLRADTASSSDKTEFTETEDQSRTHQYDLRLENSVSTIGTCPYFLPSFVGRPSRDVLRPSQPSDGPALTGHCGPELLDGPRHSVVRVLTCSGSSKLANMLFQVCRAPR